MLPCPLRRFLHCIPPTLAGRAQSHLSEPGDAVRQARQPAVLQAEVGRRQRQAAGALDCQLSRVGAKLEVSQVGQLAQALQGGTQVCGSFASLGTPRQAT